MIDSIEDEGILQMVMEDIAKDPSKSKVADKNTQEQLKQLKEGIFEEDKRETIDWRKVFKIEINEWGK